MFSSILALKQSLSKKLNYLNGARVKLTFRLFLVIFDKHCGIIGSLLEVSQSSLVLDCCCSLVTTKVIHLSFPPFTVNS